MASATLNYIVPTIHIVYNLVMPEAPGANITIPGLITNQFTPQNHTATLPDGYVANPCFGAAYKVYNNISVSWKDARKLCFAEGAQLALIDSVEKFNYIKEKVSPASLTHVGIQRFEDEWVSVRDGTVVTSIPWQANQPSGNGNCVKLRPDFSGLHDGNCVSYPAAYVCEFLIPTSS